MKRQLASLHRSVHTSQLMGCRTSRIKVGARPPDSRPAVLSPVGGSRSSDAIPMPTPPSEPELIGARDYGHAGDDGDESESEIECGRCGMKQWQTQLLDRAGDGYGHG